MVWKFGGIARDSWGNIKADSEDSGTVNRKDCGLDFDAAQETGGALTAGAVKPVVEVETDLSGHVVRPGWSRDAQRPAGPPGPTRDPVHRRALPAGPC